MQQINTQTYWEKRLSSNFSLHGVGDIGLGKAYNGYLYKVRAFVFRNIVKQLTFDKEEKVLDIGSGTGFYINLWKDTGLQSIHGSDITRIVVNNLTLEYPDFTFFQLDVGEALPKEIASNKYDFVSSFDVLFHIVEDEKYKRAIENIAHLIKHKGYFIYSDNFMDDKEIRVKHQVCRKREWVEEFLRENGFVIQKYYPMFFLMNDPINSKNKFLKKTFNLIYRFASKSETMGRFIGTIFYPIEILLLTLFTKGYSTEILVCQKKSS